MQSIVSFKKCFHDYPDKMLVHHLILRVIWFDDDLFIFNIFNGTRMKARIKIAVSLKLLVAAFGAQAQEQTICAGSPIPAGWVKIATSSGGLACGSNYHNVWTIKNTAGQSAMTICAAQDLPTGWVRTGSSTLFNSCQPSSSLPGNENINNAWTIQNIAGQTALTVCASQAIPSGWMQTGSSTNLNSCKPLATGPVPDNWNNVWTLSNTQGKVVMDVCAGQQLPAGWVQTGTSSNFNTCAPLSTSPTSGAANNIWSIKNGNVSCSLQASTSVVAAGQNFSFTISSVGLPMTTYGYWYGAKDGVTDNQGTYFGVVPGAYSYVNAPGSHGTYSRSAQIRDASGNALCTTNTVSIKLLPTPVCTLSVDKQIVAPGQNFTFTVGGLYLPNNAQAYWYGTKNGVVDINGEYFGVVPTSGTYVNGPASAGAYTRQLQIRDGATSVCTTDSIGVTLQ